MRPKVRRPISGPARAMLLAATSFPLMVGCAAAPDTPDAEPNSAHMQPATQQVDPTGRWCFKDRRGRDATDVIERVQGGIIIDPAGRDTREIFYTDAGLNRYRLGDDASYRFLGNGQATWERRDERRSLRRCG